MNTWNIVALTLALWGSELKALSSKHDKTEGNFFIFVMGAVKWTDDGLKIFHITMENFSVPQRKLNFWMPQKFGMTLIGKIALYSHILSNPTEELSGLKDVCTFPPELSVQR
ncbi:hypothetical protein CEXT_628721 [Caerostris extrusa]|uniref:Uncharacterized protein n=1 Tax=Caerostris extrusa TaxID=172846 RepID=A0AAV4U6M8_CAEEX|nr:hypothetical protein CEXT_628721 [Caerostris extrusa]